ncbi:MAG: methyltransferase domain-containing protein [Thermoplasmatota archaeon]
MHGRLVHELPAFWRRLDRQAERTRSLRSPLYARAGVAQAASVLDVGCGSGAVTADLIAATAGRVVGVDVAATMAVRSRSALAGQGDVLRADGHGLPFPDASFDVAACNLTLMWCRDPERVVCEMARVVRPGGSVLASMEPDYGGKVHWPENPLIDLVFQGEGIRRRGGDPHAGRRLRSHFVRAGLRCDIGISTTEVPTTDQDLELFRHNRAYYRRLLAESGFGQASIAGWEAEYEAALFAGTQTSFLPIFWAIGRKPVPGDVDAP